MARVPQSGGIPGGISRLRMPQVRHMKELFKRGVNPVSGSIPAGTRVKIVRGKKTRGGR